MDFFAAIELRGDAYLNGADSYTKLQRIYLHSNDKNSMKS